jgi:hypothetical protein
MRQVIENGSDFSKSHFFMLLMNLTEAEIQEQIIVNTLRIIIEELEISEFEYAQFNQGIKDTHL